MSHTNEDLCLSCVHYQTWNEHHPYGSTTASEQFEECGADAPEFEEAHGMLVLECTSYEPADMEVMDYEIMDSEELYDEENRIK